MNITAHDLDIGAKTIAGEARGETMLGQQAVAWVILNRVRADLHGDNKPDWWGEGIAGVCLKSFQFSCWNANDPNRKFIEALGPHREEYRIALRALLDAIDRLSPDPTASSTHYHHDEILPSWAVGCAPNCSIGHHVFYALA